MADKPKSHRPPPDPNSAKYKLGQIAARAYSDAMAAKERGELVGWCSSNFPVEIPETLGLYVVYPENQAAGIAARGGGERLCQISEADGYSNDICAWNVQRKRTFCHSSAANFFDTVHCSMLRRSWKFCSAVSSCAVDEPNFRRQRIWQAKQA